MPIPRGPAILLGLGVVLFFDVLRVFLPSLITLYGRAGETPAEQMGLYAAVWFVLPFLAALVNPRWSLYGGALALVTCRLLLQAEVSQLSVASAGVTAGLIFLYGCARTLPRAAVPAGLAGGLAISVLVHMVLDGVDLVWRDGPLPWLGVVTLCAAFFLSLRQSPSDDLASSSTWFLFGPTLLLVGLFAFTPAADMGVDFALGAPLHAGNLAMAATLIFLAAWVTSQWAKPHRGLAILGAGLIAAGALPALAGIDLQVPFLAPGLGLVLGMTVHMGRTPRRPGLSLLGGMLLFLVATFLYYAAYDIDLGFSNAWVPVVVALIMSAIALVSARLDRGSVVVPQARRYYVLPALLLAALALTVGATAWRDIPDERAKPGDTFTLIAYNIRMGFGLDGRLSLDDIAAWAASKKPDVVLLSEVDRGWLLNGGHDDLERIARGLGMRYYFAPAADRLWGDALLTNLPVHRVVSHKLGKHDYPTGAQAQEIILEVGGKEVGVVNTHLQAPAGQAPEVAALVRKLAGSRPVVLAGDLNTTHGDPQMKVLLAAGLTDPLVALGDPKTSPADAPAVRIDHVLVTKGLTAVDVEVPRVPYSDHLPVVTTLRITTVDQGG